MTDLSDKAFTVFAAAVDRAASGKLTPDEMQAWLDRKPPALCVVCDMPVDECASLWAEGRSCCETCHDCRPDSGLPDPHAKTWRSWFSADGTYLGERSARTGPDDCGAVQRCDCPVCQPGGTNTP